MLSVLRAIYFERKTGNVITTHFSINNELGNFLIRFFDGGGNKMT